MKDNDDSEKEILLAYERGQLKSVASNSEIGTFEAAARATGIQTHTINERASDLPTGHAGEI